MSRPCHCLTVLLLATTLAWAQGDEDPAAYWAEAAQRGDRTWERVERLHPELGCREIFTYALLLCESNQHPDRLQRLFEVAARMQDRDQESRGYGNLRWRWREGAVLDANAVEFTMQDATVIWLKHRDALPEGARTVLKELMEYAVQGCLRHSVGASYTNIALMNAYNLVLLGQLLGQPKAAEEGRKRLERICTYTWEAGIHEYNSPTYTGVDLDSLVLLAKFADDPQVRTAAETLLELFWTSIALNWYEPANKTGGTHSRDYDYLHGLGYLDRWAAWAGWLSAEVGGRPSRQAMLADLHPDAKLAAYLKQYPRLIRESWGTAGAEARTQYVLPEVALSSSSAAYGSMDLPLTADLAGDRQSVRCYFVPDGRHDPYGKMVIPAGPHLKTLHLTPFFAAAQRKTDALALVVYRAGDLEESQATLESHFVMPRDVDEVWVDDRAVKLTNGQPTVVELQPNEVVAIRRGGGVVGVKVPWSLGLDGGPAKTALVDDGNPYGAIRLTVAHHSFWGLRSEDALAAAAFCVRVGSGLSSADFAGWRRDFAAAHAAVTDAQGVLHATAESLDGRLSLTAGPPFRSSAALEPAPPEGILELDGRELGRPLLERLPFVAAYRDAFRNRPKLTVSGEEGTYLEAEAGSVVPDMEVQTDPEASGGKYVWTPGEPGEKTRRHGQLSWTVTIQRTATYYLWGRVKAPTPDDDSFMVEISGKQGSPLPRSDWPVSTHQAWEWVAFPVGGKPPVGIELQQGQYDLILSTREDGTSIDMLYLTTTPDEQPK